MITLDDFGTAVVAPGIPTILVLDVLVSDRVPAHLRSLPSVVVGEPGSAALERVRAAGTARLLLSYEESRTRLSAMLPLLEEIADGAAALQAASERLKHVEFAAPVARAPAEDELEGWDAADAVLERLGTNADLTDEFRRILRAQLRISTVLIFRRDGAGYRADQTEFVCPPTDPLCALWSRHPAVLDGHDWPATVGPSEQVAVRQRMSQWGARLLVPVHENGALKAFFAAGVREDGSLFGPAERARAVAIARLYRRLTNHAERLKTLTEQNERWRLAEHYLPNVLVLGGEESIPKHIPAPVRMLISEARANGEVRHLSPGPDQPFRARAGRVAGTEGVWVYWEDGVNEVRDALQRQRNDRLALLHDLALTLNHELGNALVSLAALRHRPGPESSSGVLMTAIHRDIANLEAINRHLGSIPTFSESVAEQSDVRTLLRSVAERTGAALDPSGPSVALNVVPKLVEFALESIIESVAENRPELGKRDLTLRLRTAGSGEQPMAHISLKGPKLALEGVLPAPLPGDIPNHGRVSVFVAKEIVRLHGGEVRANQTTLGAEILISLRGW
ncbi:hypothetical protein DB347_08465 [Opitutaceae bacterium EW11]|nr:hypothetical protein DB347_08465 [Opitutaceae bacterium EW11]